MNPVMYNHVRRGLADSMPPVSQYDSGTGVGGQNPSGNQGNQQYPGFHPGLNAGDPVVNPGQMKPPYQEKPGPKPPYPEPGGEIPMPKPVIPSTGGPQPVPNTPDITGTGTNTGAQGPSNPGGGTPAVPPTPGAQTPTQGAPGNLGLDFMRQVTPNELVQNQLNQLLSSNSQYMRNAQLRGAEMANRRGMLNSSIAAGNAQRASLEAAMPIAQADAQVYRDANAANFQSLAELRRMRVAGDLENWLQDQNYNREINRELTMLPINSSMDMLRYIMERGLDDPAVYTPNVMSGFSNFFNLTMRDMFRNFFGNPAAGTAPGGG